MQAVELKDIVHKYKKLRAVNRISFSVSKGEFFIIIGPNGSGKTTIIKLLCAIEKHFAGNINIFGKAINDFSAKKLAQTVALVPQKTPEDFPFSVESIVLMGRAPHMGMLGMESAKDKKIAKAAMEFANILHLAHRKLDQLSGGEQQRVFIARAICQEPEIILLDEPTAALDMSHQIRMMDILEQLKTEKNMTVIMVSHDLNLAAMYGERLMLLEKGSVVKIGAPAEVLQKDVLSDVYGCNIMIKQSPLGNLPEVVPVPEKFCENFLKNPPQPLPEGD